MSVFIEATLICDECGNEYQDSLQPAHTTALARHRAEAQGWVCDIKALWHIGGDGYRRYKVSDLCPNHRGEYNL